MKRFGIWLQGLALLGLGTFLGSCQTVKNLQDSTAPVYLVMTSEVNEIQSDVMTSSGALPDGLQVVITSYPKSSNATFPFDDTQGMADVHLTRMRMTYVRVDGGVAVPESTFQEVSFLVKVESTLSVNVVVVPSTIKIIPPLSYLRGGGLDPETHVPFINAKGILEFWGETNSGHDVYTSMSLMIRFADYAD